MSFPYPPHEAEGRRVHGRDREQRCRLDRDREQQLEAVVEGREQLGDLVQTGWRQRDRDEEHDDARDKEREDARELRERDRALRVHNVVACEVQRLDADEEPARKRQRAHEAVRALHEPEVRVVVGVQREVGVRERPDAVQEHEEEREHADDDVPALEHVVAADVEEERADVHEQPDERLEAGELRDALHEHAGEREHRRGDVDDVLDGLGAADDEARVEPERAAREPVGATGEGQRARDLGRAASQRDARQADEDVLDEERVEPGPESLVPAEVLAAEADGDAEDPDVSPPQAVH